ncbi:MAG: hypothetical protein PHU40_06685 [Sulfurimonas sp.]|nr:hypothetical protein [Sulfurimonas sp.]
MHYTPVDLQQPFQQVASNAFRKFSDQELERNIRQTIEWDMLREYDFIIQECYILVNKIYENQNNSLTRDLNKVYFTDNGNNPINKIDDLHDIETELSTVISRPVKIVKDTKAIVVYKRNDPHKIYERSQIFF